MLKLKLLLYFFLTVYLSTFYTFSTAQSFKNPDSLAVKIDSIIDQVMTKWDAPGIAIGIVKDSSIIFKKGYGYKNVKNREPVTPKTLFSIGSSTKSFAATGIGILVDEGKMEWEKSIRNYLPYFDLKDNYAGKNSTAVDILSHRTGLPGHGIMQIAIARQYDREGIVKRLKYLEPSAPFRTRAQYQNQMYQVATVLIEEVADTTWEAFTRERILGPLNMKNTTYAHSDDFYGNELLTTRYTYTPDSTLAPHGMIDPWMREVSGSGSIYSNTDDLCNWIIFNNNRGGFNGRQVISKEVMRFLHHPHMCRSDIIGPEMYLHSYALGWDVLAYRGHLLYAKPGGYIGITSQIVFLPEDNIGIVILANLQSNMAYWMLTVEITDVVLGLEPFDWFGTYSGAIEAYKEQNIENQRPFSKEEKTQPPSKPLDRYTGEYKNEGYGTIEISKKNDGLLIDYIDETKMMHYDADTFQAYQLYKYYKFKFEKNEEGEISALKSDFEPQVSEIIFRKE